MHRGENSVTDSAAIVQFSDPYQHAKIHSDNVGITMLNAIGTYSCELISHNQAHLANELVNVDHHDNRVHADHPPA